MKNYIWLTCSISCHWFLLGLGSCHPFHSTLPGQMESTSPNPGLPNTLMVKSRLPGIYSQDSNRLAFSAPYGEKFDKRHLISLAFSQTPLSALLIPSSHIHTLSSFLSVIFFCFVACLVSTFLPCLAVHSFSEPFFDLSVSTDVEASSTLKFPY